MTYHYFIITRNLIHVTVKSTRRHVLFIYDMFLTDPTAMYARAYIKLMKEHDNYLISIDYINQSDDIVTSENTHITINNYSYVLNVIYVKQYISLLQKA